MAAETPRGKEVIAIAGVGDLGRYICEELLASPDFTPIILSRSSSHPFATAHSIALHQTTYEPASLLPILDSTYATTLISFISPTPSATTSPHDYVPLHSAMLDACRQSSHCKRFIPSEWAGHGGCLSTPGRWFSETRGKMREVLKAQKEVVWTGVAIGWLGDYFLPRPEWEVREDEEEGGDGGGWETRTYMRPVLEMWGIDVRGWKAHIRGTGDERQSWICGRDVGKAIVWLCRARDWEETAYLAAEWSTFNSAISTLEAYYKRPMPRTFKSVEEIQGLIDQYDWASEESHAPQVEEMSLKEQLCLPRDEVMKQREKFFKEMNFRGLEEILEKGRNGFV